MKNENYNEYDSTLDGLIGFLEGLPQASVKMLDLERYMLMLRVAAKLIASLKESTPEGEVNIVWVSPKNKIKILESRIETGKIKDKKLKF